MGNDFIYDWNNREPLRRLTPASFELVDETLRDGLQSPSVRDPDIEDKKRILHLMESLNIAVADIGLPGAGPRARADVAALTREIRDSRLSI